MQERITQGVRTHEGEVACSGDPLCVQINVLFMSHYDVSLFNLSSLLNIKKGATKRVAYIVKSIIIVELALGRN